MYEELGMKNTGIKYLGSDLHDLKIVACIETECAIVHGNRELICFAAREEKVWEGWKKNEKKP